MMLNAGRWLAVASVFALSGSGRSVWRNEDSNREDLPELKTIPAASTSQLTPASGWPSQDDLSRWERSHGSAASTRYSSLQQINRDNVNRLGVAWQYHSKDGTGNIQCNPIVVCGTLYAPTVGHHIVALNAATGVEIWRYHAGNSPAFRGLAHWRGTLFFTTQDRLVALNAKTGRPVTSFGAGGSVAASGTVAPAVYRNVLVVPLWNEVKGFEVETGRELWRFRVIPRRGESGYETWGPQREGANCWGGMALDESRGIAFISTGSPHPNFDGTGRHGSNLFSNSVIALDALTGRMMWYFQEIAHDIWDLDLPAPPNLVTVERAGKRYDAVAQVTKIGATLLLDRLTGKPLFPFRLRRAPASSLPGERTSPYQPAPELPEPFARQDIRHEDVASISGRHKEYLREATANATFGWFHPFELGRPNIYFGIHGGAEWSGASFDPILGRLYVSSNHIPWNIEVIPAGLDFAGGNPAGRRSYDKLCAMCHGAELQGRGSAPSLLHVRDRMTMDEIETVIRQGRGVMPGFRSAPPEEVAALVRFIGAPARRWSGLSMLRLLSGRQYGSRGYKRLLDPDGYPASKPPWGTLNAIDLQSGRLVWKAPLGEYPELTARGIPKTGTENFGGPTATAGGLVFCAGTMDKKLRAFDSGDGRQLWEYPLPFGGFAPPAVYQVEGKEYVVIAASGGGKLGGEQGDAYVAFTLQPPVGKIR